MDTWVAALFWLWKIILLWTWPCRYLSETLMRSHTVILNICVCVYVCLVTQLCLILHDPMHCIPPDSSVHGIHQARILEWVAISFIRGSSWPRDWTRVSCISCVGRQILYHWATWEARVCMCVCVCVCVCVWNWKWKLPSCLWLFATP